MPSGRPSRDERVQQRPLEVLAERGLPGDAARLLQPDRRRDDRLVRAALGRERDARRGADEDRLAARVHPERPRLERAVDERVVDRADRQQRLAVARPRRAELARAARRGCPPRCPARCAGRASDSRQRTSVSVSSANQSMRSPRFHTPTRLIQPPRFVEDATSGLTVTTCSATLGRRVGAGRRRSARTPAGSTRRPRGRGPRSAGTPRRPAAGAARRARAARRRARHSAASGEPGAKPRPRIVGVGAELAGELRPLRVAQQRRVVARVALGRQPPGLDRVGEDHRRPVVIGVGRARTRRSRSARSWPPRSRTAAMQLGVVEVGDDAPDVVRRRAVARAAARAARRRRLRRSRWYSSLGIASIRSRSASPPSRANSVAQPAPVLDRDRLPAGGLEHRADPAGGDVGHDAVQRLAVEVDDPQHLAQVRDDRVDERLPDRALVELGVADQRDLASALRHVEVPGDVAVRERAPDRRGRPDPHRAGREVDRVGVLQRGSGSSAGRRTRAAR